MPLIQIALDLLNIGDALRIAGMVADYVDYIEAGTPLIKVEGLKSVRLLKDEFSDKTIVADLKTMDTGYLEASQAFKYGADYTTVMALADIATIGEAIRAGVDHGRGVMVDALGLRDVSILKDVGRLNPSYIIIHSGIDMQERGITPFKQLMEARGLDLNIPLGVAGGIKPEHISKITEIGVELIIVGGYIVKATNPVDAAKRIRDALSVV